MAEGRLPCECNQLEEHRPRVTAVSKGSVSRAVTPVGRFLAELGGPLFAPKWGHDSPTEPIWSYSRVAR